MEVLLLLSILLEHNYTTGVFQKAGTAYHSRVHGFPLDFGGMCVAHLLSFLCCIVFLCFACLRPVSCVPDFASVSGLSILDCFLCCIVFLCFACLRPVSCVPDFASVSWLSIPECFLCCIVFLCFAGLRPLCA